MNILIVEDEKIIASSIQNLLKKIPFTNIIDIAHDFETAFQKVNSDIFDLILVDIFLGKDQLNGFELCKIIRKQNEEIPLIIITAYHSIQYIEKAFSIGVNDYITKPFNHKEVEIRSKRWLMLSHKIKTKTEITYAELEFYPGNDLFLFKKKKFVLSKKQKNLLLIFLQKPNITLSKEYLSEKLWGDYFFSDKKRNIRSNIQLLKKALPKGCRHWIKNVRGEGYALKKENF